MYRSPKALPPPPHRLLYRWIWVVLISSAGLGSILLFNWSVHLHDNALFETIDLIAVLVITILTWASVGGYAWRWAGMRIGCLRVLLVLLSPVLLLLGIWFWNQVAPAAAWQLWITKRLFFVLGPPWFGMLLLSHVDVLWPRRSDQRPRHEPTIYDG